MKLNGTRVLSENAELGSEYPRDTLTVVLADTLMPMPRPKDADTSSPES
jgi:hypothetical protein